MGIDVWHPRAVLANAQAPLQQSTVPSIEVELEPISVTPLSISPQLETRQEITHDQNNVVVEDPPSVNEPIMVQTGETGVKPIRFGLGLYLIGDYIVVSSLTSDHQLYQSQALALIQNILKSFSNEDNLDLKHHHVIAWPFFTNSSAEQGVIAAKQYVNGVIEHLTEKYSASNVVIFGGVLPKLNGWKVPDDNTSNRLILPSVYKMMSEPRLKAKAWQLIQNSNYFKS